MGLYGSEYWTYLLPKRVGPGRALELTEIPLPVGMKKAKAIGLIDAVLAENYAEFQRELRHQAEALAKRTDYEELLELKREQRWLDESIKPLAAYRAAELRRMRMNFQGKVNGTGINYHQACHDFVYKVRPKETASHLAKHSRFDVSRLEELRPPWTW